MARFRDHKTELLRLCAGADWKQALEERINQIVGVVTNGLFALRPADVLLLGTPQGVQRFPG